jgi:plasmid maintenance system killer protein
LETGNTLPLEISFPDDLSKRLYERWSLLEAEFGVELAKAICRRLAVLNEAGRLAVMPTCRPIELKSDGDGRYSVALGDSHRLVFRPANGAAESDDIQHIEIIGVIKS